jgi:hypothetical protein
MEAVQQAFAVVAKANGIVRRTQSEPRSATCYFLALAAARAVRLPLSAPTSCRNALYFAKRY